jgi:hypothetical protein
MIQQHHAGASASVEDEIRRVAQDPEARARWRLVQKRIRANMQAAEKDARPTGS